MSRVITVLLLVAVAASPREAVVVPVGPKGRTEAERQCVRQRLEAIVDSSGGGRLKDAEYTLDFAATLGGKLVAGKRLYHPVKCAADAKLGALARGMAQGHNSMETMSTPARQDMLVGALEGFLEDLPSS